MASVSSYTEKQVRDLIKTSESGMPYPTSTTQSTKNQTVDHTGVFRLNRIGKHALGMSGVVTIDDTEGPLIEATTGNYYLVGHISFGYPEFSNNNFRYRIYLNGIQVWGIEVLSGADANLIDSVDIVVPAYTELKITAQNASNNTGVGQVAILTGRIYNA